MNLYIEQMEQSIHHDYAFKVVFVQFAYCRNHLAIDRILTFSYLILESVWFFDGTDQAVLKSFIAVLVVTKFFFTLTFYFGVFSDIFEALLNNFYFLQFLQFGHLIMT